MCYRSAPILRSFYKATSWNVIARRYSQKLESMYSDHDKVKILKVINEAESDSLTKYTLTNIRLNKLMKWRAGGQQLQQLSDIASIDGFSDRIAIKFFNSVLDDGAAKKKIDLKGKLRGKILNPTLDESVRKDVNKVLAIYVTIHSVSWSCIKQNNYELCDWGYHNMEVPEGKKLQISDIMGISWSILSKLPTADLYVMEAPPTTLRASGSDPNNPKVLTINLQKAQLISMLVALVNARRHLGNGKSSETTDHPDSSLQQAVYFLRANLSSRLYGTFIGNERVSTEQTVNNLFTSSGSVVSVPQHIKKYFLAQRDIEREVLGQCLLLVLTFMEICFYKNTASIERLVKRGE